MSTVLPRSASSSLRRARPSAPSASPTPAAPQSNCRIVESFITRSPGATESLKLFAPSLHGANEP
ncbi:MAG: hypothetical protein K0Q72_1468 [Armatimonadetes bacterium]|nr:hypothetical protein [Armatimonadota bacterium]